MHTEIPAHSAAGWPAAQKGFHPAGQRPYGGPDLFRATLAGTSMSTIDEHIQKDKSEIEAARAAGDDAKVRHLENELKGLEEYKAHHPEESHDPTPLEVFCDMNPEAPECLVYDD